MSPILQSLANGSARGYGAFGAVAAAPAFESIASANGTGSSDTITFSSIPSGYESLQIRATMRETGSGGTAGTWDFRVRFNSDTGTNYAYHQLFGDGTAATATGNASATYFEYLNLVPKRATTADVTNTMILDIHDYKNTSRNKTLRGFMGYDLNGTGRVTLGSGVWMQTSAITSITIYMVGVNISTSSTFALYGVKGA